MKRLALGAYLACLCGLTAVAHAAPLWFGWFDNPHDNPGDRLAQIAQHGTHSNVTMSAVWWHPEDWDAARAAGVKVGLMLPNEIFWAVSDANPTVPPLSMPMWCRMDGWCNKTLADWVALMEQHRDDIAFVLLADEVDCNLDDGSVRFPNWTYTSCQRAAAKVAMLNRAVKQWMPWMRTWVNTTSAYAFYWRLAEVNGRHPSVYGVSLPPSDLVSFDCYTPFGACYGRESVKALYDAWKPYLSPTQRFLVIPRAFTGAYLGWNPAESEIGVMAWQYYRFAQDEPRVDVVLPFLWRGPNGAMTSSSLRTDYTAIGQLITGRAALTLRPAAPTGVRIVRE